MTALDLSPLLGPPSAYAGIGSRETPPDVLDLMTRAARWLAQRGWTLRSGAAQGADSAFEVGVRERSRGAEIYLPWPSFEGRGYATLIRPSPDAWDLARRFHPAWGRLPEGARAGRGASRGTSAQPRGESPPALNPAAFNACQLDGLLYVAGSPFDDRCLTNVLSQHLMRVASLKSARIRAAAARGEV